MTKTRLPVGQFVARDGIIDLGWGHPDPDLLPVDGIRRASARALDRYGPDALNYGYPAGPGPLIAWLCDRLGEVDARPPTPDGVVVTAGNSQGLDQVATLLTAPGEVVLVESPTYYLALRIFRDHPVELTPVAADHHGLRVDVLADTLSRLRRRGRRVSLLYTVPTFNNPMGVSLGAERRQRLVDLAAEEQITIVEDDVYRELSYDGRAPASLWSLAPPGVVVRLGSFAKSLAPGLRTGYITSDPATTTRIRDSGLLDSGGGISHFAALVVAEFAASGDYARNVERLRAAYRARRDALISALSDRLEGRAHWLPPAGGYFVWLTLPLGQDAAALLPLAESEGTSYVPGANFYTRPSDGHRSLRLAFSRYPEETLTEAVRRLAVAVGGVSD
jgi:2-aminoadipate transaminase